MLKKCLSVCISSIHQNNKQRIFLYFPRLPRFTSLTAYPFSHPQLQLIHAQIDRLGHVSLPQPCSFFFFVPALCFLVCLCVWWWGRAPVPSALWHIPPTHFKFIIRQDQGNSGVDSHLTLHYGLLTLCQSWVWWTMRQHLQSVSMMPQHLNRMQREPIWD